MIVKMLALNRYVGKEVILEEKSIDNIWVNQNFGQVAELLGLALSTFLNTPQQILRIEIAKEDDK